MRADWAGRAVDKISSIKEAYRDEWKYSEKI